MVNLERTIFDFKTKQIRKLTKKSFLVRFSLEQKTVF